MANPPAGVGREAETKPVIELIDGAQQTDIAFLNEIQVTKAVAAIFLRNGGDQTQVCLGKMVLCRSDLRPLSRIVSSLRPSSAIGMPIAFSIAWICLRGFG